MSHPGGILEGLPNPEREILCDDFGCRLRHCLNLGGLTWAPLRPAVNPSLVGSQDGDARPASVAVTSLSPRGTRGLRSVEHDRGVGWSASEAKLIDVA